MDRRLAVLLAAAALGACAAETLPRHAEADAIDVPLVATDVDPSRGQAIFVERASGHCVLCHRVAGLDTPFQGNLGPALTDVGARLTPGQIRLRIVDASRLNPETIMPPYYRTGNLHRVAPAYRGRPALPAEDIEDLVAWLASLGKEQDRAQR